jgi:cobalt-zinc-cadmium efflux system protein
MHAHDHGAHAQHGHHAHAHGSGVDRLAWAVGLTAAYGLVELLCGWWFGSLALVSDAGHMFSDALALALALLAAWLSRRPAGARHSFGLARAEVVAAFVNGLAMLLVVVLIAVEAISRLLRPEPVVGAGVMVVAFVGLLLNLVLAYVISSGERTLNVRAALLHVTSDLLGSVAALAAGAVITFTGWNPIDPILSLVIAGLILVSTLSLLRETLHVLMEGVPRRIKLAEVGHALARVTHVRSVHDLHIWNISSGQVALSAHLELASLDVWPGVLEQSQAVLRQRFGIDHVTLQPELAGTGRPPARAIVKLFARR